MPYNPPFCEITGILIERCQNIKLNETTTVNGDVEILNALRYIQFEPSSNAKQDENGYQSAEIYRLYLQDPDPVRVGDKVKFNGSKYMKKQTYNNKLTDTVKLEVKEVQNYQIGNCEGYIEVICATYN